jgi:aminotransferase
MTDISERELELPDLEIGKLIEIAAEHKEILSLGPGEPDFGLPKPLIDFTKKVAGKCNHYSPPGGRHELKEAIIKKLKKENKINASADEIVVTCGSQEALLMAAACTMDVSEEIIIPDPSFMAYMPTIELFNAVPRYVQLKQENDFAINPDDIKKSINRKTKVILINSPANPTGNVLSKKILEEVADIAVDKNLYVFTDEAYEKIVYDGAKHISIGSLNGMKKYAVSFFTFSKTFAMCGFRLGFCVAPKPLAKALTQTHVYTTICAPTISQMVGTKALSLPAKYTNAMVKEYDRRRKMLYKRLNEVNLHCSMPKGAFYFFANIQEYSKDSKKFAREALKKAKVAFVPGRDFGKAGEGYCRFSYATDYKIIEKAMDRLDKYLKKR